MSDQARSVLLGLLAAALIGALYAAAFITIAFSSSETIAPTEYATIREGSHP